MNFTPISTQFPLSAYTNHPLPITINGNLDFLNQAGINGWSGDGSENTPYSISNLNITNSTAIDALLSISNTDVFFNITDSLFDGGLHGILLHNVANGLVENNVIVNAFDTGAKFEICYELELFSNEIQFHDKNGVYLFNTNETTLFNNTIWNNNDVGILCDYTEDILIWDNEIFQNDDEGILIREGEENTIEDNDIYENGQGIVARSGIRFGNSDFNNVTGNFIYGNRLYGIECGDSDNILIDGNAIYENEATGVILNSDSIVTENTFYNNEVWGLRIFGPGCTIHYNNFIDNNLPWDPHIQAVDGPGNNDFSHNYWSGWIIPDENEDGIVDIPYLPDYVNDETPLTYVEVNSMLHLLTKPAIIYPNDDYYVRGDVNITWGPASDTFGHEVQYNVSYSMNNGSSFTQIQDGIDDTFYVWDSSGISTNQYTLIRIDAECTTGLTSYDITDSKFAVSNIEHSLSPPNFMNPTEGERVGGNVNVECEEAIDSWYLPVSYDLYYLQVDDEWQLLIADSEYPSFVWNTTEFGDGEISLMVIARNAEDVEVNSTSGIIIIDNEPDPKKIPGFSSISIIGISTFAIIALVIIVKKKHL